MSASSDGQMTLFTPPSLEVPAHIEAGSREVLNKEEVRATLNAEFAEARKNGSPLSVITADLNALKAVNDELGHDDGDTLIDLVGTIIDVVPGTLRTKGENDSRPSDIVSVGAIDYSAFEALQPTAKDSTAARIGGDEFIIILPDTDEEGAQAVVERIREAINKHLDGPEGDKFREKEINVGLALGAATLQPDMATSSDLLRISDEAMYKDKMDQLPPLSKERINHLLTSLKHLNEARVRPRDLPRYIDWLGAQALLHTELEED